MEGRHLMIIEMPTPQELPRVLRERQVDGLIVTGRHDCREWLETLSSIPLVVLSDSYEIRDRADIITNDSQAIGEMAAACLLSQGCRRPAFLNHDPSHSLIQARGQAFRTCLEQQGVAATEWLAPASQAVDPDKLWATEWMRQSIGRLLDRMLAAKPRPDGLFLATDHQTAVVYSLLRDRGIAPGQEIKIVSCGNNEPWLLSMSPRPATIDPGTVQEGREAVRRLINRIAHPYDDPTIVLVKPRLVLPG